MKLTVNGEETIEDASSAEHNETRAKGGEFIFASNRTDGRSEREILMSPATAGTVRIAVRVRVTVTSAILNLDHQVGDSLL